MSECDISGEVIGKEQLPFDVFHNKIWRQDRKHELKCYNIIHAEERTINQVVRDFTGRASEYGKVWYSANKERVAASNHKHITKWRAIQRGKRIALIEYLGSKCAYCAFNDVRALQLDHIHGNGRQQLRERFNNHSVTMYRYYFNHLDEAKRDLQVLCANCNFIKRYENGEGWIIDK